MALFKPVWMTDKPSKTRKAVASIERMDDQAALMQVVCDAPMDNVKETAFAKLDLARIANRDQLIALAHHAPTHVSKLAVLDRLDDDELWNYLIGVHDNDLVRACAQRITDLNWLYENLLNADLKQWDIWSTSKVAILDTIVDRTDDEKLLRSIVTNRQRITLDATAEECRHRTVNTVGVTKAWQSICCKALGKATGDSSLYDIVRLPSYRRSIDGTERLIQFELMKEKDPELARLTHEIDEDALMAVYQNTSQPIEHRVVAAKRLATLAGNEGPCRELLDNCTVQKRHLLYQTEYVFWERQESMCIRCLERGGSYEDDGHTRHFGFAFWEKPCSGDLPYDGCDLLYVKNSQGQMAISHSRKKTTQKPAVVPGQRIPSRADLARLAKLQKEEQEARAKAEAESTAKGVAREQATEQSRVKALLDQLQRLSPDERKRFIGEHADDQEFLSQAALFAPGTGTQMAAAQLITNYDALVAIASSGKPKASKAALAKVAKLYPDKLAVVQQQAVVELIGETCIDQAADLRKHMIAPDNEAAFDLQLAEALINIPFPITGVGRLAKDALPLVRSIKSPDALMKLACNVAFEDSDTAAHANTMSETELLPVAVMRKLSDNQLRTLVRCSNEQLAQRPANEQEAIANYARLELTRRSRESK